MSKRQYLWFCAIVIALATMLNLSLDDDGSYRHSGGYYSGSGFSGGHK